MQCASNGGSNADLFLQNLKPQITELTLFDHYKECPGSPALTDIARKAIERMLWSKYTSYGKGLWWEVNGLRFEIRPTT